LAPQIQATQSRSVNLNFYFRLEVAVSSDLMTHCISGLGILLTTNFL